MTGVALSRKEDEALHLVKGTFCPSLDFVFAAPSKEEKKKNL